MCAYMWSAFSPFPIPICIVLPKANTPSTKWITDILKHNLDSLPSASARTLSLSFSRFFRFANFEKRCVVYIYIQQWKVSKSQLAYADIPAQHAVLMVVLYCFQSFFFVSLCFCTLLHCTYTYAQVHCLELTLSLSLSHIFASDAWTLGVTVL